MSTPPAPPEDVQARASRELRWSVRKAIGRVKRAVATIRIALVMSAVIALCAGTLADVPGGPAISVVLAVVFVLGAVLAPRQPLAWALVAAITGTLLALLGLGAMAAAGTLSMYLLFVCLVWPGACWFAVREAMLLRRLRREQPELVEAFWKKKPRRSRR